MAGVGIGLDVNDKSGNTVEQIARTYPVETIVLGVTSTARKMRVSIFTANPAWS